MRDGNDDLREAGIQVVGISGDTWETQARFAQTHRLSFILLGDPDGKAIGAYGANMGFTGFARRVTFLVDPQGQIAKIWDPASTGKHAEEVLAGARELDLTRQETVP